MKKKVLTLTTASLFAFATLFTLSSNSQGHLSFFKKAHAEEGVYYTYYAQCSIYPYKFITVCGQGTGVCEPAGTCY